MIARLELPFVTVRAIGAEWEVSYNGKRRGVYQSRETAQAAADALARGIAADARMMEGR